MNRKIHPTASRKMDVRRIDDGIASQLGDVGSQDMNSVHDEILLE